MVNVAKFVVPVSPTASFLGPNATTRSTYSWYCSSVDLFATVSPPFVEIPFVVRVSPSIVASAFSTALKEMDMAPALCSSASGMLM